MRETQLSIVVPAYNAQRTLQALYDEIAAAYPDFSELIFVDDGSKDESESVLRALAKNDSRVRVIFLEKNKGQQEATLCGITHASCEYIANLDADLQNPPALLYEMLEKLQKEKLDILYAVQAKRKAAQGGLGGHVRDWLFRLLYKKSRGVKVSAFRVMTRSLAQRVLKQRRSFNYFSALVFSEPVRSCSIFYPYIQPMDGRSNYSFSKRLRLFLRIWLHYGALSFFFKHSAPQDYPIKEMLNFA